MNKIEIKMNGTRTRHFVMGTDIFYDIYSRCLKGEVTEDEFEELFNYLNEMDDIFRTHVKEVND